MKMIVSMDKKTHGIGYKGDYLFSNSYDSYTRHKYLSGNIVVCDRIVYDNTNSKFLQHISPIVITSHPEHIHHNEFIAVELDNFIESICKKSVNTNNFIVYTVNNLLYKELGKYCNEIIALEYEKKERKFYVEPDKIFPIENLNNPSIWKCEEVECVETDSWIKKSETEVTEERVIIYHNRYIRLNQNKEEK